MTAQLKAAVQEARVHEKGSKGKALVDYHTLVARFMALRTAQVNAEAEAAKEERRGGWLGGWFGGGGGEKKAARATPVAKPSFKRLDSGGSALDSAGAPAKAKATTSQVL